MDTTKTFIGIWTPILWMNINVTGAADERYVGCFKTEHSGSGGLPYALKQFRAATQQWCIQHCMDQRPLNVYQYAALKYGYACSCGVGLSINFDATFDGGCTSACRGDTNQTCGGSYYMSLFRAECLLGSFGPPDCLGVCHCDRDENCHRETGECQLDCPAGMFGEDCMGTCHCQNNSLCDPTTGSCANSQCLEGWMGTNCQMNCPPGKFGSGCIKDCQCQDPSLCDGTLGKCSNNECPPGKMGDNCQQSCIPGTFGDGCLGTCHCQANDTCYAVTGSCASGLCLEGWMGDHCQMAVSSGGVSTGLIAGATVGGLFFLLLLIIAAKCFFKRGYSNTEQDKDAMGAGGVIQEQPEYADIDYSQMTSVSMAHNNQGFLKSDSEENVYDDANAQDTSEPDSNWPYENTGAQSKITEDDATTRNSYISLYEDTDIQHNDYPYQNTDLQNNEQSYENKAIQTLQSNTYSNVNASTPGDSRQSEEDHVYEVANDNAKIKPNEGLTALSAEYTKLNIKILKSIPLSSSILKCNVQSQIVMKYDCTSALIYD